PNTNHPRQNPVIVDVVGEANRVEDFGCAGIDEKTTDDDLQKAPNNRSREHDDLSTTPNAQHPTSNVQLRNTLAELSVERWALSVGRCSHFFVLSHSSHPPWSTNTQFLPSLSFN